MTVTYIYFALILVSLYGDVFCMITPSANARAIKYARYSTHSKQEIVIPIMIHLDIAMAHQKSRIAGYKKTKEGTKRLNFSPKDILREVEKVFNVKDLNQKVKLELVNARIVNNKTFDVDENVSKYLRNYCTWQKTIKTMKGKPYFSVLLTGLDVYYIAANGKKVRESTGRGYMGKMCSLNKSCAVVKWHPKDLVYLLAHEIAHRYLDLRIHGVDSRRGEFRSLALNTVHPRELWQRCSPSGTQRLHSDGSLGVYHDGTHNSCKTGYIMTSQYSREHIPRRWSTCSKAHLLEFLRNKEKSWCLTRKYKRSATLNLN